jgi:hypothetical protein
MISIYFSIGKSCFLFFMRSQPPLFPVRKACFLLLYFYCDHSLHFSLSTKPIPQCFMRLWRPSPPLFLIRKPCFLFLSFLYDYGDCFSFSVKPVFCSSIFYATMTIAFPCLESLFYVPWFFKRSWPSSFLS